MNTCHLKKNQPRLLLVDDVLVNLRALVDMLQNSYELQFATSGQDALMLVKKTPAPDLILLDVMMPGMDGYAVCREIKRQPALQHVPVVFITALDAAHDEVLGLEAGASDYIIKPFEPDVAMARIRSQLTQKFAMDTLRASQVYPSQQAVSIFRNLGAIWEISFQGRQRFHLKAMLGLSYLQYLLMHPERYVSVEEMVFLVSPRERDKIFEVASGRIDKNSLQFYQLQTQQLMDQHQSVSPLTQGLAQSLVQSDALEQLLGELRRVGLLGSGAGQAIDNRERFRKSVGNAIRRAVGDIAHHDSALASYFQHPTLRLGYELVYVPDPLIVWKS